MSPVYSLVVGSELVKVHDPDTLFAAAAAAGIPFIETTLGMVWADDGPYLRVESTRRIRKTRPARVKAGKMGSRPPEGRILELASRYAAIPAAFDDSLESNYSPLDD